MHLASRHPSHWLTWPDALVGVGASILSPVLWSVGHVPLAYDLMARYIVISVVASLICIGAGQIGRVAVEYFTTRDAFRLFKVAAISVLMISAVHFMVNRGEGIGRALPAFHFFILTLGLFVSRAIAFWCLNRGARAVSGALQFENVILIGASLMAVAFISASRHDHRRRVLAVLDRNTNLQGRSISGCPVIGKPASLGEIITEYATHGVTVDKVFLAIDQDDLKRDEVEAILAAQARYNCRALEPHEVLPVRRTVSDDSVYTAEDMPLVEETRGRSIWAVKRTFDTAVALASILILSPLFLIGIVLVLRDVGFPAFFWQERLGRDGRVLKVVKFRTMCVGDRVPTGLGSALRRTRIDELPQLLNVLRGEMALIGPRPLLATEQRQMSRIRLAVRPGLTGWAQVCGANLCTLEQKFALDEWYVENASLMLDARILLLTARVVFFGEVRRDQDIAEAMAQRAARLERQSSAQRKPVVTLILDAHARTSIVGDAQPALDPQQIITASLQG